MEGFSEEDIAKAVTETFGCSDEEAKSDVLEYIESCVNEGILEKE